MSRSASLSNPPKRSWVPGHHVGTFAAFTLAMGLVEVSTLATYWADLRNDQYQLINLGYSVYSGQRLYIDCWENKPPGIAWIGALGYLFAGGRQIGAWILPGIAAAVTLTAFAWAVRRLYGRAVACWSLLLASVVVTQRVYDAPSINPDFYSAMFDLLACSAWLLAVRSDPGRRVGTLALAAGLCWAASATVKQTGCVGLAAASIGTIVAWRSARADNRRWLRALGLSWAGFGAGLTGVVLVLLLRGTIGPAWHAAYSFNVDLASIDKMTAFLTPTGRLVAGLGVVQLPLWIAVVGLLTWLRAGDQRVLRGPVVVALVVWWIAQCVLALIGPSQSMRYWQATWPPMLWLAAAGLDTARQLFRRAGGVHRPALVLAALTGTWLLGGPMYDQYRHGLASAYVAHLDEPNERTRLRVGGERIRELVPEGSSIYVWSYDVGWYVHAQRQSACRYTYPRSVGQMEEILRSLEAREPYCILMPSGRASAFDEWCDESCDERVATALAEYVAQTTVGPYTVWVRHQDVVSGPLKK